MKRSLVILSLILAVFYGFFGFWGYRGLAMPRQDEAWTALAPSLRNGSTNHTGRSGSSGFGK